MSAVRKSWCRSFTILACLSLLILSLNSSAKALPISLGSGTLSVSNGGIFATNQWNTGNFSISYNVTEEFAGGPITYAYALFVPCKDISNLLIQVSSNFTAADLLGAGADVGTLPSGDPTTYSPGDQGNSHPGLPRDLFGYKFDNLTGTGVLHFWLTTWRLPMWGDVYAKDGVSGGSDGTFVYAYNSGFGQIAGAHILVPDSASVPEPTTMLLLGSGLLGLAARRRSHRA